MLQVRSQALLVEEGWGSKDEWRKLYRPIEIHSIQCDYPTVEPPNQVGDLTFKLLFIKFVRQAFK